MDHCQHPTPHVHYEHQIDEDDSDVEDYWCDLCNCWLTPADVSRMRERADYPDAMIVGD